MVPGGASARQYAGGGSECYPGGDSAWIASDDSALLAACMKMSSSCELEPTFGAGRVPCGEEAARRGGPAPTR